MKTGMVFFNIILFSFYTLSAAQSSMDCFARSKEKFNSSWKFSLSDNAEFSQLDFNDASWRTLDLPHDWSVEGKYSPDHPSGGSGGYFPEGVGWYRKTFSIDDSLINKQITIQFDGVYMNSEVWINENFLGRYPYGYSTFQYDLTEFLNFGCDKKNVIAVRVDNSLPNSTRWYNGSGIYRNVYLITTNYTHFNNYHGVYITTSEVSQERATVHVDYEIIGNFFSVEEIEHWRQNKWNRDKSAHDCMLRSTVYDKSGNVIARIADEHVLYNFDKNIKITQTVDIENPKLWSADLPNMYSLKSEIIFNGNILDDVVTPFGVRKLEYIPNKGMFVNGKEVKLKGVCLHHDAGSLGAAVPLAMWKYRLQKFKVMGCNAIRTAHNPFAPEFYDLCDQIGFYVMDEAFDEWTRGWPWNITENNRGKARYGYHLYFDQWAETDLKAMLRRDRNHPSIVMYSIGNEVPDQLNPDGYKIAEQLVQICHDEDPTRPVTSGCDQYLTSSKNGFIDALDISGYNYIDRAYKDSMYVPEHNRRPEKLCVGTETSNTLRNFIGYRDYPFAIGQFIWVGQDYLGEAGKAPQRGWQRGLIDISGNPQPAYYRHKAYWSDSPFVHIVATNDASKSPRTSWNWHKGDSMIVTVYSNCEEVELFYNKKSLGRHKVDLDVYAANWPVIFKSGEIKAVGYQDKRKVTEHVLQSTGEPFEIVATPVSSEIIGDDDVSIVEISIMDKKGRLVPEATNNIKIETQGDVKLVGMDSGYLFYDGSFQADNRDAYRGRLLAIFRIQKDGPSNALFTSPHLIPAMVNFSGF